MFCMVLRNAAVNLASLSLFFRTSCITNSKLHNTHPPGIRLYTSNYAVMARLHFCLHTCSLSNQCFLYTFLSYCPLTFWCLQNAFSISTKQMFTSLCQLLISLAQTKSTCDSTFPISTFLSSTLPSFHPSVNSFFQTCHH